MEVWDLGTNKRFIIIFVIVGFIILFVVAMIFNYYHGQVKTLDKYYTSIISNDDKAYKSCFTTPFYAYDNVSYAQYNICNKFELIPDDVKSFEYTGEDYSSQISIKTKILSRDVYEYSKKFIKVDSYYVKAKVTYSLDKEKLTIEEYFYMQYKNGEWLIF